MFLGVFTGLYSKALKTLSSLNMIFFFNYLPILELHMICSEAGDGAPTPSLFSAFTRKLYGISSIKSVNFSFVSLTGVLLTGIHLTPDISQRSTW